MRVPFCVIGLSVGLAACANPSSGRYDAADVGRTIETSRGEVVSSRIVDISGDASFRGPVAGGIVGATASGIVVSSNSNDNRNTELALALGALVGAAAGYLAEEQFNNREGIEYVLDVEDGRTVKLVQNRENDELPLPDGTPVLIQVGGQYTRAIPAPEASGSDWVDPSSLPPPPTGEWVDPDTNSASPATEPAAGLEIGAGRVPGGESRIQ